MTENEIKNQLFTNDHVMFHVDHERSIHMSNSGRVVRIYDDHGRNWANGDTDTMVAIFARATQTDITEEALLGLFEQTPRSFSSHYDYLKEVLPHFWILVFGKTMDEMWVSGIIGTHGDKGSGCKYDWKPAGIHYQRGMLLFLISYPRQLGVDRMQVTEWSIEHYQEYLPKILEAERIARVTPWESIY